MSAGGGGGGEIAQVWQWSNKLRCQRVNGTQLCATAISSWKGHLACEQLHDRHGAPPVALSKITRGGGLRFDGATGTLRLEGCDGACAGADHNSALPGASIGMALVNCTDSRATGFSLGPP